MISKIVQFLTQNIQYTMLRTECSEIASCPQAGRFTIDFNGDIDSWFEEFSLLTSERLLPEMLSLPMRSPLRSVCPELRAHYWGMPKKCYVTTNNNSGRTG
jgi:hypothetical protein